MRGFRAIPCWLAGLWLGLAAAAPGRAEVLAGPVTNRANGHRYFLLAPDTWQNSEVQAVALGGHLVMINDEAEQSWVFSTFGAHGGIHRSLWLGLHQVTRDGVSQWEWVSGEPVGYTRWLPNEPVAVERDAAYAHMVNVGNTYGHPGGMWNDLQSPNRTFPTFNPVCGVVEVGGQETRLANPQLIWAVGSTVLCGVFGVTILFLWWRLRELRAIPPAIHRDPPGPGAA